MNDAVLSATNVVAVYHVRSQPLVFFRADIMIVGGRKKQISDKLADVSNEQYLKLNQKLTIELNI